MTDAITVVEENFFPYLLLSIYRSYCSTKVGNWGSRSFVAKRNFTLFLSPRPDFPCFPLIDACVLFSSGSLFKRGHSCQENVLPHVDLTYATVHSHLADRENLVSPLFWSRLSPPVIQSLFSGNQLSIDELCPFSSRFIQGF